LRRIRTRSRWSRSVQRIRPPIWLFREALVDAHLVDKRKAVESHIDRPDVPNLSAVDPSETKRSNMTLALAACGLTEKPEAWVRSDGRPVVTAALSTVTAECRNEAVMAVAKFGKLEIPGAYAEAGSNPYVVSPGPTYRTAPTDFSAVGRWGDDYAAGAERRRLEELRNQIMRTTMDACMAHSGYIRPS
jgi:hypothetical protein